MSLAAAAILIVVPAGPSYADSGSGSYSNGWEIPSEHVTFAQGHECARFHKVNDTGNDPVDDPTTHVLPMAGNFGETGTGTGGNVGTGTATFTITQDWFANQGGTHASIQCNSNPNFAIPGTLEIEFDGDDSNWSCTGDATYTRSSMTTYVLTTSTLSCDNLGTMGDDDITTSATFSGTQVLCGTTPLPACNNPNAGTNLNGSYSWSN